MLFIPKEQLTVPSTRQRREFEANELMELADSIFRLGLLHPLVVRPENGGWVLVAGERRKRAIEQLWEFERTFKCNGVEIYNELFPAVSVGDLEPLDAFEAELEENIRRMDLTWQERAQAIADLHKLRVAKNPEQTTGDTAREVYDIDPDKPGNEIGEYRSTVQKALTVTRHMDDPDVSKAKSLKDAFKIIEQKEQLEKHAQIAAIVGQTFGAHVHKCLQGDCIAWMRDLPPAQFDFIITDPPYGMNADEFGDAAGRLTNITHEYSDSPESFKKLMLAALPLFGRVAKAQAHLYVCCDIEHFTWLRDEINAGTAGDGWRAFRTPLVNNKLGGGRVPLPEHGPRRSYELILYAFRGGKKMHVIAPDVISTRADENMRHGAQKPIALYTELLQRSAVAGDTVLDPFCGTGPVFPAAHGLKCSAVGIELNPAYYGMSVERIEELE